ncbi:MAG TPA: DUF1801 domain-containing protein [Novosphingobium sp.]|nr:DUF1801 domain-containing protein [Novosphingobium sp.]
MDRDQRVDDYIAAMSPPVRAMLEHLRDAVARALPEAVETIKWKVPHYTVDGRNVAGLAGFKAHCSLGLHGDRDTSRYVKITGFDQMPDDAQLTTMLQDARDRIVGPKS